MFIQGLAPMKRNLLLWVFVVLVLALIFNAAHMPFWIGVGAISLAFIADLYAVRISILGVRTQLELRGLELGQVIPSTVVIFGWLLYAVVHLQVFLAIVHFLGMPAAALKWVFPLTAFKSLWLVYYLGSKLPVKRREVNSSNKLVFQFPWALGGAYLWWVSNQSDGNSFTTIVWAIVIVLIDLSPGIFTKMRTL